MIRQLKKRKAAVLTLFVLLLPILLVMLGFSVDVAYMQMVQTEMRLATDNAARVAADSLSRYEDETRARNDAISVASAFTVAGKSLQLTASDIDFGRASSNNSGAYDFDTTGFPPNSVRVNALRSAARSDGAVPLFFSRLIGAGEYQPQVSATAAFLNVDICLVLDRSTSMKFDVNSNEQGMYTTDPRFCKKPGNTTRWKALHAGVSVFTNVLRENTSDEQVGIVTYASNMNSIAPGLCGNRNDATLDLPMGLSLDTVDSTMNTLSNSVWNGNTNIGSGVVMGTAELISGRARRYADKVMIVLTDGHPTHGNAISAAASAKSNNIVVHAITFGNDADQGYMKQVAAAGGGDHAHATDQATLEQVFREFAAKATVLIQ